MEIAIIVATISATVTILGWLVNHILSSQQERKTQELVAQMKFTERQLEELYGPLAFLIWDGKRTFEDLLEILGRNYVFPISGTLTEDELNTWLFWLDNYFFPKNEKIKELLMTKTHLIEGEQMPKSYLAFLEHHNSWYLNHLRWKKEGIRYSWRSKINAPREFEKEILDTFKNLKTRHTRALRKLSAISESAKATTGVISQTVDFADIKDSMVVTGDNSMAIGVVQEKPITNLARKVNSTQQKSTKIHK